MTWNYMLLDTENVKKVNENWDKIIKERRKWKKEGTWWGRKTWKKGYENLKFHIHHMESFKK